MMAARLIFIRLITPQSYGKAIPFFGLESSLTCPHHTKPKEVKDAGGKIVTPGLIDCHTHLCFGGWRADEFEMRIRGKSYLEIAKAGGGILSTVTATRAASEDQLYDKAAGLLRKIIASGVTSIECKSGYGALHRRRTKAAPGL